MAPFMIASVSQFAFSSINYGWHCFKRACISCMHLLSLNCVNFFFMLVPMVAKHAIFLSIISLVALHSYTITTLKPIIMLSMYADIFTLAQRAPTFVALCM